MKVLSDREAHPSGDASSNNPILLDVWLTRLDRECFPATGMEFNNHFALQQIIWQK